MLIFAPLDLFAIGFFLFAWFDYAIALKITPRWRDGLNHRMNAYREMWMLRALERDNRIVDSHILTSLQNGTAFFASTSLIALGGALTLLRSTDEVLTVIAALPFGIETSRAQWEAKTMGLAVIFVYAFFKFAWSYRLFNYVAIMLGAMPLAAEQHSAQAKQHVRRVTDLFTSAGRHFNRGQRGFFFALGYLGWFAGPWILILATTCVVIVMWRRQFASEARDAVAED